MKHRSGLIFMLISLFSTFSAHSQIEFIVAPNQSEITSNSLPQAFVNLNSEVYFGAEDFYGPGFWKSDGTGEGTRLVTRKVYPFFAFATKEKILMIGHEQDGNPTFGFWISDGTEAGTSRVTTCDARIDPQFTRVGNQVFFRIGKEEVELWVTEGTAGTTHRVTGTAAMFTSPDDLTSAGGLLYFSAVHPQFGKEAWRSDGTAEGTFQIGDLSSGSSSPYGFCERNDTVYFIATADAQTSLYATDGTEENTAVAATFPEYLAAPDHNAESLKEIMELGDTIYFGLRNAQTYMNDIYRYVSGDTISLCYAFPQNSMRYPALFYQLKDHILLSVAYPNPRSPDELWLMKIDGSGAGVYDTLHLSSYNWNYWEHQESDSVVYFEYAGHLQRTDGTSEGTYPLNDLYLNSNTPVGQQLFLLTGNRIWFTPMNDSVGTEPWIQKLTSNEPSLVRDINLTRGFAQMEIVHADEELLLFTATSENEAELWETSAGLSSASMIKGGFEPYAGSKPRNFLWFGNELYFSANDTSAQYEGNTVNASSNLWKSDGTPEGTMKVSDFITGYKTSAYGSFEGAEMAELNGKILLGGSLPNEDKYLVDVELYATDGTAEGFTMVKNINNTADPFNLYSNPFALRKAGNRVFFGATTEMEGTELWVTDGSESGTHMVKDIDDYGNHSSLSDVQNHHNLTPFGDRLLFTPYDGIHDRELWISDGTETGTKRQTDILPGGYGYSIEHLSTFNDKCVFWVDPADSGVPETMWITDGTPEGTGPIRNLEPPSTYWNITEHPLGNLNGTLYFTGTDSVHGFELWKTDGTPEGTMMVMDIFKGQGHSLPEGFVSNGDKFYFIASSGIGNTLLWESDGTAEGTLPVEGWDKTGMRDYSNITRSGGYLYFTAMDLENGQALYRFYTGTSHVPVKPSGHLSLYPNPAGDQIFVNLDHPDDQIRVITIIDLSGRVLIRMGQPGIPAGGSINISALTRGVYLVQVDTGDHLLTRKFIKHE